MASSVGQYLINDKIPQKYKILGSVSAKGIQESLEKWAKEDPKGYAENIPAIKRIADQISMYEGFSIGMDDISPLKKEKNELLSSYYPKYNMAKTNSKKKEIVADAMLAGAKLSLKGSGSMVDMVHTGARGNSAQLMKNILTPVSSRELNGTPYPYFIKNSYSEGLTPGEYWVASIDARNAVVDTKTQTAEPGDFGKQLFNVLNNMVVSTRDCGTQNGIMMKVEDYNIMDRYLAKDYPGIGSRNTLITEKLIMVAKKKNTRELMVRSPMSCEARNGVCQLCYGLNTSGHHHEIGTNVGTIAAQSLSEPLTQMALSSKHGVKLTGKSEETTGMKGVRKLFTKPKHFPNKSALAQVDGRIIKIIKADQGGHYVYVGDMEHYVPIHNTVTVKVGDRVSRGDALSDGLKDPREFTELRGIGSGRNYMVSALYNSYNPMDERSGKRTGLPIDKRHLEVLAKKDLNHVVIDDHNDTFTKGDVVDYNKMKSFMQKSTKEVDINQALGELLGKEYMHYTVGTEVTPNIIRNLKSRGINKVFITERKMKFHPFVTNIRQIPLLKENFIARLSHQGLKNSLLTAVREGQASEVSGYDPIPSFIKGVNFGEGIDGRY